MSSLTKEVFYRAVEVLKGNRVKQGLRASTAYYNQVWARDSFISFIGAGGLGDEALEECAKANIETFTKTASPLGQIANFFDLASETPEFGYSGSTDSTCFFIIALASLYSRTRDRTLLGAPLDAAVAAYKWLRYQDANNTLLIDSPQGADWMDAAVQRTGKTLYNNTLFLIATKCIDILNSAAGTKLDPQFSLGYDLLLQRFNDVFLPGEDSAARLASIWPRQSTKLKESGNRLFSKGYYLQYVSFFRMDERFDSLSNLLCVSSGIADSKTVSSVLEVVKARSLDSPYPVRVLDPPYEAEGASFHLEFDAYLPVQHRSTAYSYHNGGVWPFVGGFYVASLFQAGSESGPRALEALARANSVLKDGEEIGFNEWIHGRTGEALGQYGQSWSAGMYIGAYLSGTGRSLFSFLD